MRRSQRGCLGIDAVTPRVDPVLAHEVAAAYLEGSNSCNPLTRAAYSRLVNESNALFKTITSPGRPNSIHVCFTRSEMPYRNAEEVIESIMKNRKLEVTTTAADANRRHPLMDSGPGEDYDRFRAVHDILGHARLGLGFDRDGEFSVWLAQERFYSPLACLALATELHGQHSVRWTTGEVAEPRAVLIDSELIGRSRRSGVSRSQLRGARE